MSLEDVFLYLSIALAMATVFMAAGLVAVVLSIVEKIQLNRERSSRK